MIDENIVHLQKIAPIRNLLRGKWTLEILCAMQKGPVRLSRLTHLLPDASKKALRTSLRQLESLRIIVRRDLSRRVLHVEYDFSEEMRAMMLSLLENLAQWGQLLQQDRDIDESDEV